MRFSHEVKLEQALIERLERQKYSYRIDICDRSDLEENFRDHFEALNRVTLTDREFKRLLSEVIVADVYEASRLLRSRETFIRDDGTPLNFTIVNIREWCKNTFEIVNQLRINTDASHRRYDVMLLINGVPVVQIELKTLGVSPRRAMEQIVDYKSDLGNGYTNTLLCFVQLFVVSNQTDTWYFANNNERHFSFDAGEQFLPAYQFADRENRKITHLDDFADRFLAKCTLGQMISKYVVLVASEKKLLMMRPYQIYAVQAIVDKIKQGSGNGYVWHTTGSGKTLTSFKASTLLKSNDVIYKCVFVVDRKDLDRQTREEFNRFQEGSVEENTNTASLVRRLVSDDYADKVIVTTIQKLGLALDEPRQDRRGGRRRFKERLEPLKHERMVFIFDECHRSQFGDNHKAIKEFFPQAQLFGFTGTPIFGENATVRRVEGDLATLQTTKDLFDEELHTYTITDAIEDQNVLRFHVDYFEPEDASGNQKSKSPSKRAVVQNILDRHNAATNGRRFNALFATASIDDAIAYYGLFKELQAKRQATGPEFVPLKVTAVFTPPADGNPDVKQLQEDLPQERADNRKEPNRKKAALNEIIVDYNERYGTLHRVSDFDLYYKDVQQRIKDQRFLNRDLPEDGAEKIDITIVVDMLLTGFDARYLNTLYVDKPLRHHGLIQAFSRTNRVLNATKPFGHVLDFRGQCDRVDEAIALFSGADQKDNARQIWLVDDAPIVIQKLEQAVADLDAFLTSQGLPVRPEEVVNLRGDDARIGFVERFKEVQRFRTQLDQYTDLDDVLRDQIETALPGDELRAFRGAYLETALRLKASHDDGTEPDDAIDDLDLELVLFSSAVIDYDYIMGLIAEYANQAPDTDRLTRDQLIGLIESDAKFLDERDSITAYVRSLEKDARLDEGDVYQGYEAFKVREQASGLAALAKTYGIPAGALSNFVDTILKRMIFDGEQLTDLLEPLGLGWRDRRERELALMDNLVPMLRARADGREISGLSAYNKKEA